MNDPRYAPLFIDQGRTNLRYLRIRIKQTGLVADLPDMGFNYARLQIRDKHRTDGGTLLLDLTTDNGGIVLGPVTDGGGGVWSLYLYVAAEAAETLIPWGEAVYDLYARHDNGEAHPIRYGPVSLVKDVGEL